MEAMTAVASRDRFTRADLDAMSQAGRKCELLNGSIYISPNDPGAMFTRADLDEMPDEDGRYELLNGTIVVSPPSPGREHQWAVPRIWRLLEESVIQGLEVYLAPFEVTLSASDIVQPDVLVVDGSLVHAKGIAGAPRLAVEVLSPSTRARDLGEKLQAYRDAGVPSYWVFDPIDSRLVVRELREGEYVEVADVSGDDEWTSETPYPVTVRPSDLVR